MERRITLTKLNSLAEGINKIDLAHSISEITISADKKEIIELEMELNRITKDYNWITGKVDAGYKHGFILKGIQFIFIQT